MPEMDPSRIKITCFSSVPHISRCWSTLLSDSMALSPLIGRPVVPEPEPDWWWSEDSHRLDPSLEDRFKRAPYLSTAQRDELVRLLRDIVHWEPSRRISAAEVDQRLRAPVFASLG
ncbi:hypothetical protein N658DRAFT_487512 [Parathielavia hyrcaniae]|uniref:Uncharacterized protein n=1 Tax=Parathielavia hyrcaniae TaxID=113614 RepID=A0AAN6PXN5_9PEZI|nr:hypothetical protein N658DRAFT_487512 [Parathielavia hyrcaniae]